MDILEGYGACIFVDTKQHDWMLSHVSVGDRRNFKTIEYQNYRWSNAWYLSGFHWNHMREEERKIYHNKNTPCFALIYLSLIYATHLFFCKSESEWNHFYLFDQGAIWSLAWKEKTSADNISQCSTQLMENKLDAM